MEMFASHAMKRRYSEEHTSEQRFRQRERSNQWRTTPLQTRSGNRSIPRHPASASQSRTYGNERQDTATASRSGEQYVTGRKKGDRYARESVSNASRSQQHSYKQNKQPQCWKCVSETRSSNGEGASSVRNQRSVQPTVHQGKSPIQTRSTSQSSSAQPGNRMTKKPVKPQPEASAAQGSKEQVFRNGSTSAVQAHNNWGTAMRQQPQTTQGTQLTPSRSLRSSGPNCDKQESMGRAVQTRRIPAAGQSRGVSDPYRWTKTTVANIGTSVPKRGTVTAVSRRGMATASPYRWTSTTVPDIGTTGPKTEIAPADPNRGIVTAVPNNGTAAPNGGRATTVPSRRVAVSNGGTAAAVPTKGTGSPYRWTATAVPNKGTTVPVRGITAADQNKGVATVVPKKGTAAPNRGAALVPNRGITTASRGGTGMTKQAVKGTVHPDVMTTQTTGRKRTANQAFSGQDNQKAAEVDRKQNEHPTTARTQKESVKKQKTAEPDICPICLSELTTQQLAHPDVCRHVFCLGCLQKWQQRKNTCPIDNKVFQTVVPCGKHQDKVPVVENKNKNNRNGVNQRNNPAQFRGWRGQGRNRREHRSGHQHYHGPRRWRYNHGDWDDDQEEWDDGWDDGYLADNYDSWHCYHQPYVNWDGDWGEYQEDWTDCLERWAEEQGRWAEEQARWAEEQARCAEEQARWAEEQSRCYNIWLYDSSSSSSDDDGY